MTFDETKQNHMTPDKEPGTSGPAARTINFTPRQKVKVRVKSCPQQRARERNAPDVPPSVYQSLQTDLLYAKVQRHPAVADWLEFLEGEAEYDEQTAEMLDRMLHFFCSVVIDLGYQYNN